VPFRYVGMNSIAIYACHEIFAGYVPLHWPVPNTHAMKLASHVLGVSCWVAMSYYWHENGMFFKV
jgi:hypothetical protein